MVRRCRGNCGKHSTVQPYKDSRVVYFECTVCEAKRIGGNKTYFSLRELSKSVVIHRNKRDTNEA